MSSLNLIDAFLQPHIRIVEVAIVHLDHAMTTNDVPKKILRAPVADDFPIYLS